jgi:hypothetical protein
VHFGKAGGFTLHDQTSYLSIVSTDANGGDWHHHTAGVQRSTSFGNEEVVANKTGVEQFLTVGRHVGKHTWSWLMSTNLGEPDVRDSGVVAFVHNHLVAQHLVIAPPQILDASGHRITPKGLRWSTAIRADGKSYLQLTVDDSKLPVPYVIDPAITFNVGMSGSGAGVTSYTVANSVTVNTGDLLVAALNFAAAVSTVSLKGSSASAAAFTPLTSVSSTLYLYGKIADANDLLASSATFNAGWTTATGASGIIGDYTNLPTGYLDLAKTVATNVAPSIVPNQDGQLVVAAYGASGNTAWGGTIPAGWTEDVVGGKPGGTGAAKENVELLHQVLGSATAGTTVTPPTEIGPTAAGAITATFRNTDTAVPTTSSFSVASSSTLTFSLTDSGAGPAPVVPLASAFTAHLTPDPPGSAVQNLTPTSVAIGAASGNSRTVTLTFTGTPFKTAGTVTLDYSNANASARTAAAFTTASGTSLTFTSAQAARFPSSGKVIVGG